MDFREKKGDVEYNVVRKKFTAQMIDPKSKASLGPMSTLMRFQDCEKVDFAVLKNGIPVRSSS